MPKVISALWHSWQLPEVGDPPPVVAPPPPQVFYTRRGSVAESRPIVTICNQAGFPLGRLNGEVGPISWRTGTYGRAQMTLPPEECACRGELIAPGNKVLIEFQNGLLPWGGVVDLPRDVDATGMIVNMYSIEYVLGWSLTPRMATYTTASSQVWTPARILHDLISTARLDEEHRILGRGNIDDNGTPITSVSFSYQSILDAANRLHEMDGTFHWHIDVIPRASSTSSMSFVLHPFYVDPAGIFADSGVDDKRYSVRLIEGYNFIDVKSSEQGPLVSSVIVSAGNDDVESPDQPEYALTMSRPRGYGKREKHISLPGVTIPDGASTTTIENRLRPYAVTELDEYSQPRLRFTGTVINRRTAPFSALKPGVVVGVTLTKEGRRARDVPFLISAMEYDPRSGTLSLVGVYQDEAGRS